MSSMFVRSLVDDECCLTFDLRKARSFIYTKYYLSRLCYIVGEKKKGKEMGADFIYLGALLKSTQPASFGRIGIKISV